MIENWTGNSGIIGFGIFLIYNNKIEITDVENISQYFSEYTDTTSNQSFELEQLWDIDIIDDSFNKIDILLLKDWGDNQGIDQITYIIAKINFTYSGDYTSELINIEFDQEESQFYTCFNPECTSYQSL